MSDEYENTRLTLIDRLRDQSDDKSWEDFAKTYEKYILAIILRMGVPYEDSKDVLQVVLLDAWKALPKFEYRHGKSRFRSWLSVITRHATCRFYRKFDQPVEMADQMEAYTDPEVEKIAEKEWKLFVAQKAFDNIKGDFSEHVIEVFLAAGKKMENEKIAEKYGLSSSSVRVYKMRVQNAVQKEMVRLEAYLG